MGYEAVDDLDKQIVKSLTSKKDGFEYYVDKYELGWAVCPWVGHDYLTAYYNAPIFYTKTYKKTKIVVGASLSQCKRAGCGHRSIGRIQRFLQKYKPLTNFKRFIDDLSYHLLLR